MNREIKRRGEKLIPNFDVNTNQYIFFRKFEPKVIADKPDRKKQNIKDIFSKDKYQIQHQKLIKHKQKDDQSRKKPSKLHSQEQMMMKINKILMKSTLSKTKYQKTQLTMNTQIEEGENYINHKQISSKISSQFQKYTPFTTQNEQQHKQNCNQHRKSQLKLELSKLRAAVTENGAFYTQQQTNQMNFTKNNFEKYRFKTEIITPSDNKWQNSMKLLRLQKKQNERSRKYCRILIRRINTDFLFTNRTQSHARIKSNKNDHSNHFKPTKNSISQSTHPKIGKKGNFFKNQMKEQQSTELNPWSTTQIKMKQQSQLMHH